MWKFHYILFYLFASVFSVFCYDKLLVDELRVEFLKFENDVWNYVLTDRGDNDVDRGIYITKRFHEFDQKMQKMPDDPLYGMQVVRRTHPFLLIYADLKHMCDMYDKFRRFQEESFSPSSKDYGEPTPRITIEDMVGDIIHDKKNNANHTVRRIFERSLSSGEHNMIEEIFDMILDKHYQCQSYSQPIQQVFYNLYNALAIADLKGYMMMQFAYLAQRLHEKGNNTESSLIAREEYKIRANITATHLRGALELTKGTIENNKGKVYRCDPKVHVEGKTYEQLTRLLQGHVENEVDLNVDRSCKGVCEDYSSTRSYGCYDSESEHCRKRQTCAGEILGCRFVEPHLHMCLSPSHSYRRYEHIGWDSGRTYGNARRCSNVVMYSWTRWFVRCNTCMCLCDAHGPMSDRYFNLRPVLADTSKNRVITGLKIIKHNRLIHLQIQEGKLLPFGYIDNTTVQWRPVDNFKITDRGIKNNEDYHTMDFYKRSIYLDDLYTHETNHLVTGVRFEYLEGHLRFQIRVTPFDFKTGILLNNSYFVYGPGRRVRIGLDHVDIPTKTSESEPNWDSDSYIDFTHSDFEKDAAQTTVPFIDRQPVFAYPPVPLRGAGIYYKGKPGYGGFIAPTIVAYDYSKHLKMEFPDPQERLETWEDYGVVAN